MNKVVKIMLGIVLGLIIGNLIALNVSYVDSMKSITQYFKAYSYVTHNVLDMITVLQSTQRLTDYQLKKDYTELNNKIDNAQLTKIDITHMLRGSVIVKGASGLGSGTVIKITESEIYILTCAHVVADIVNARENNAQTSPLLVTYLIDDKKGNIITEIMYAADIVKYDDKNDLALLKIYFFDSYLDKIKIANDYPQLGDVVFSVGNPLGIIRTISRGILSNHKEGFYFSDNTTIFGNSGGGLYNRKGELIGVPAQVMGYTLGGMFFTAPESSLGLSIDLYRIQEFLKGAL